MRVFSYIVKNDSGFAPNPFHKLCTLACCKPKIRKVAKVGDIVIGLTRRAERVAYAMEVSRAVSFADYWTGNAYAVKRPKRSRLPTPEHYGDNIYEPVANGDYRQHASEHSNADGSENAKKMKKDLRGTRVLVSEEFVYFGGDGPTLPKALGFLRIGRGHRSRFDREEIDAVVKWFAAQPRGVRGTPSLWPSDVTVELPASRACEPR